MDDEDDKERAADDGYSIPDLPAGVQLDGFYTDDAILAIPGTKVTREELRQARASGELERIPLAGKEPHSTGRQVAAWLKRRNEE